MRPQQGKHFGFLCHSGRIPGTTLWVKSEARFLFSADARTPPPLILKPSLWFSSSSFVTPLSIISYSQQRLLLIKDVNLWFACSPPPQPFVSLSRTQGFTSGAAFQKHGSWQTCLAHKRRCSASFQQKGDIHEPDHMLWINCCTKEC